MKPRLASQPPKPPERTLCDACRMRSATCTRAWLAIRMQPVTLGKGLLTPWRRDLTPASAPWHSTDVSRETSVLVFLFNRYVREKVRGWLKFPLVVD